MIVILLLLQELAAYGGMNLLGSMFSGFNTAGGLSRSTVQAVSGGKTQVPLLDYYMLTTSCYIAGWFYLNWYHINCFSSSE